MFMGVGTVLKEPCLQPGQKLDGARVSRIFSQKILWLKPDISYGTRLIDHVQEEEVCL